MAKLVSKVYGEALFETAMEEDKADVFLEEIGVVRACLAQNPDFEKMMKHPGIPKQDKIAAMHAVFDGRVSGELTAFLEIILDKERYGALNAVFDYFTEKVKEEKKIGVAHVTTAVELSGPQKEQIRGRLLETTPYLTMEIHYDVDRELIGGMVIRIKDRVVDSSIRTKLEDLTRQLLKIQLG